ncbi:MAG: glutathione S-transferase family protein [Steroidobacteraceae bacterium]
MDQTRPTGQTYTLWGGALSLYTGKVRSYLIKAGIPYREFYTFHPEYRSRVYPTVRLGVAPILESPSGDTVQDSTDIIEYLEARHPETTMVPATPLQRAVAWLLNAYGSDGLLQAAMHYRWSYREEQRQWLLDEFGRFRTTGDRARRHASAAKFMAQMDSMLGPLGVTPQTIPAIEASHRDLLAILDEHFLAHPYLLGGRPSLADFGMMAALFGHLSRDPIPSMLMKQTASNVYRWTERMNLAGIHDPEFPNAPPEYFPGDEVPPTLEPLLAHLFRDWGPELIASAAHYNAWIGANPGLPAGTPPTLEPGPRVVHPWLGEISYALRGVTVTRRCAPHSLWHHGRATALARGFDGTTRARWDALLERTGGREVMSIELARPMKREDYVLVLA